MDRYIVAIGGAELKTKETLEIDRYIAKLAYVHAGGTRPYALFIGTASHDSMPYYNTFHKTYTGELGLKTDCALTVYGEMDYEKIKGKFMKADMIYVGGGDTLFMLDHWKKSGVYDLVLDAYERGVILSGLSAGGICWFEKIFTDSPSVNGNDKYNMSAAMGLINGVACPHYGSRRGEFIKELKENETLFSLPVLGLSDNSAAVFKNGVLLGSVSSGGEAVEIKNDENYVSENAIKTLKI